MPKDSRDSKGDVDRCARDSQFLGTAPEENIPALKDNGTFAYCLNFRSTFGQ
jgi:hypothetical protein